EALFDQAVTSRELGGKLRHRGARLLTCLIRRSQTGRASDGWSYTFTAGQVRTEQDIRRGRDQPLRQTGTGGGLSKASKTVRLPRALICDALSSFTRHVSLRNARPEPHRIKSSRNHTVRAGPIFAARENHDLECGASHAVKLQSA